MKKLSSFIGAVVVLTLAGLARADDMYAKYTPPAQIWADEEIVIHVIGAGIKLPIGFEKSVAADKILRSEVKVPLFQPPNSVAPAILPKPVMKTVGVLKPELKPAVLKPDVPKPEVAPIKAKADILPPPPKVETVVKKVEFTTPPAPKPEMKVPMEPKKEFTPKGK